MNQRTTRRDFHGAAASSAIVAALGAQEAQAQVTPSSPSLAVHLAKIVEIRYGNFLTDEQRAAVLRRLQVQAANSRLLARTPLENGDEPDFVFHPDVE